MIDGVEYTGDLPNAYNIDTTDTITIPVTTNLIAVACSDDYSWDIGLVAVIPELDSYSGLESGWKCVRQDQVKDWSGYGVDTSSWTVRVSDAHPCSMVEPGVTRALRADYTARQIYPR